MDTGTNTIARALKTIEEKYPEKMDYVAGKLRFFLIWEQDSTYQSYIRPHWGKYNILTIISDQFITYFYHWKKYLPAEQQQFLVGKWMNANVIHNHGPLCSLYKAHENGDFRSEGDSPAYFHVIPTGLRNEEHPDWGGWGGRYVKVRENTWLDPVEEEGYVYPEGRWYTSNAWGRTRLKKNIPNDQMLIDYLRPTWHWIEPLQNDFAARADWCVKPYDEANHAPVVVVAHDNMNVASGKTVKLNAKGTKDPDGDKLTYKWWQYREAGSYPGDITFDSNGGVKSSFVVPEDAKKGETIHVICEVTDDGVPALTCYARVIITVK